MVRYRYGSRPQYSSSFVVLGFVCLVDGQESVVGLLCLSALFALYSLTPNGTYMNIFAGEFLDT
jgi:hypothetical protein